MRPLLIPAFVPDADALFDTLAEAIPWVQKERSPRRESFMAVDRALT